MARKAIDKNIRNNVWRRYWGNSMDGQCWVCGKPIHTDENYQCGHIISVANRGDDNILNLIPICIGCNLGMKEENLLDYKKRYYSHIHVQSLVQPESPNIYIKEKGTISQTSARPIDNDIDNQRQDTIISQPLDEDISEKDRRERYGKYASAIIKLLPTIKKWIDESQNGTVKIKATDLARDMGGDFAKKNYASIYWGLKYVLFKEGIFVETGTHKSGDKLLIMRFRKKEDELPPSLQKYVDEDNEEKNGVRPESLKKINGKKKKMSLDELGNIFKACGFLGYTLEVYYHVLDGMDRSNATNLVAENNNVTRSSIQSSYTRSLGLNTSDIDTLMQPENSKKFKKFLIDQCPQYIDKINEFFNNI